MGKSKPPSPPKAQPLPEPPADPSINEQAKADAATAATNEKRRTLASSTEGTFGASKAAASAAPTNADSLGLKPAGSNLKSTLG